MGSLGQNVPILGIFGEKDCSIQLSEVYAFEEATPTSNTIPSCFTDPPRILGMRCCLSLKRNSQIIMDLLDIII